MNDLDRIEIALSTKRLDAAAFERCAQDMLTDLFPGAVPDPWRDRLGSRRLHCLRRRNRPGPAARNVGSDPRRRPKEHARRHHEHEPARRPSGASGGGQPCAPEAHRTAVAGGLRRTRARLDASDIFDGGFFAKRNRQDLWMRFWAQRPSGINFRWWSSPPVRLDGCGLGELVWGDQVCQRVRSIAAGAQPSGADPVAPRVAIVAALLAEVAGFAARAGVDGVGLGDDRFDGRQAAPSPRHRRHPVEQNRGGLRVRSQRRRPGRRSSWCRRGRRSRRHDRVALVAFEEHAVVEHRTGAHQRDEVGAVHGPPVLGRLDQLERHREPGGT